MVRKQYGGGAVETTLNGSVTNVATSAVLTDGSTYPDGSVGPFVLVLDPETAAEEKVLVTSRSGNNLSGMTRGYDGTSAAAHSTGVEVRHVFDATSANEANAHVNDDALDDHSQYLNTTRHAAVAHTGAMLTDLTVDTADLANGAVTAAKLAAALPLGKLGYAEATAIQAPVTSAVDVTGLSTAITAGTSRRIKITVHVLVTSTVANDEVVIGIYEGGTELQIGILSIGVALRYYSLECTIPLTPSAGAHTYKVRIARTVGTGDASMVAAATRPAFILVEDIGAA